MMATQRKSKGRAVVQPGMWLTLAFATLTSLMLWSAGDLSHASAWIPRIVLGSTLAVLVLRLVAETGFEAGGKRPERQVTAPVAAPAARSGNGVRAVAAIAWMSLLLASAWLFGVALGSAMFCAAWLYWHARESLGLSLAAAGAAGGALWLLFALLPGSALYAGILWPVLSGFLAAG